MGTSRTDIPDSSVDDVVDICTAEVYGDDPYAEMHGWGSINGHTLNPDKMDEIDKAGGIDSCIARRAARSCADCQFFSPNLGDSRNQEWCWNAQSNRDKTQGEAEFLCVEARQPGKPCGPAGHFWEDTRFDLLDSDLQEALFGVDPVTGSWPRKTKDSWF